MRRVQLASGTAPALWAAVSLAVGILSGSHAVSGAGLAAAGALLALGGCLASRGAVARAGWGALLFALAGFLLAAREIARPSAEAFRAIWRVDRSQPVQVRGRLDEFWSGEAPLRRSRLRAESLSQGGRTYPFRAPVNIWLSGVRDAPADRGDRVTLIGEIRRQDIPVSARELPAPEETFSLAVKSAAQILDRRPTLVSLLSRPNRALAARLAASPLPAYSVRGPVDALLLGRTEALDRGMTQNFRRGGLSHLLVVSGLHVALLAGGLEILFGAFFRRAKVRHALVLVALVGFAVFAGARAPVLRAAVTLGLLLLSRILEKPVTILQAAGLSALVVLVIRPAELFTAGFFLTYGAAIGIALLAGPLQRGLALAPRRVRPALAVTLAAQLATAPIVFWRYNLVAGLSWLVAPVCLPVLALLLADGALILAAVAVGLSPILPGRLFALAEGALERIAEGSGSAGILRPTPPLAAALVLLALLAAAAAVSGRLRLAALGAYAGLFLFLAVRRVGPPPGGGFSVEALDVGQGDAILLRAGSSSFLIDGGGSWDPTDEDFGRTRLLPKLLDRGVARLDGVLLSHPHPDHALGLFAVLRELPVARFYRGPGPDDTGYFARLDALAGSRGTARRVLATGDRFAWAGGEFCVLRSGGRFFKTDAVNNDSVVVLYERNGRRVLLAGDAGMPAEREILDSHPHPAAVDVLKVGHHGSRTSSSPEFLRAFAPRAALLSCGRENRFHHPAAQTLATFAGERIPLFRTDRRSDVGFRLAGRHLILFERGLP